MAKDKSPASDIFDTVFMRRTHEKLDQIIASQIHQGKQLDEILHKLKWEARHVTPELEAAIKLVSKIAYTIDEKVPDKNVPPDSKPNKERIL